MLRASASGGRLLRRKDHFEVFTVKLGEFKFRRDGQRLLRAGINALGAVNTFIKTNDRLKPFFTDLINLDRARGTILHAKTASNALFRIEIDFSPEVGRHDRLFIRITAGGRLAHKRRQKLFQHFSDFYHWLKYALQQRLMTNWSKAAGARYFQQKLTICSKRRRAKSVRNKVINPTITSKRKI